MTIEICIQTQRKPARLLKLLVLVCVAVCLVFIYCVCCCFVCDNVCVLCLFIVCAVVSYVIICVCARDVPSSPPSGYIKLTASFVRVLFVCECICVCFLCPYHPITPLQVET